MVSDAVRSASGRAIPTAIAAGGIYAVIVLGWAFSTGVSVSNGSLMAVVVGGGYAFVGLFLIAAGPVYLLGRLSLLSPLLVACWSLGNTVYLRWYVPRPHDALASYLTVWPLFVGLIVAAAIAEFAIRVAADRVLGRFGPRAIL